MVSRRTILTHEELQALTACSFDAPATTLRWFYIRAAFCVALVTANVLSLSIFFEDVFGKFDLPPVTSSLLATYVSLRLAMAVAFIPLYFWCFAKRWHFVPLSLVYLVILTVNLINDFLLIYTHVRPEATSSVAVMIALRLLTITFVAMNAKFYADKLASK